MPIRKVKNKPVNVYATLDYETDPFLRHRHPEPFCCGFYFETPEGQQRYAEFWGDDCTEQLATYIEGQPSNYKFTIFAHNGGKFDFFYLLEKNLIGNEPMLINSRIVKAKFMDRHELRDSFAMMPVALSQYAKDDMDYKKMERPVREKNKKEILKYLRADCVNLYELATRFVDRFGPKLTVASAAITQLATMHPVPRRDAEHDEKFRAFYFGGRVECFETGAIIGKPDEFKIYDINSSYPKSMRDYVHPASHQYVYLPGPEAHKHFDHKTGTFRKFSGMYFMRFIGENRGALPTRVTEGPRKGGLTFDKHYGEFFACSHEVQAACDLGLIRVDTILDVHIPCTYGSFKEYVDFWMAEKISAKNLQTSDPTNYKRHKADELFAKFMLNSAYGKFALDPTKYKNYFLFDCDDSEADDEFEEWKEKQITEPTLLEDSGRFEIWQAAAPDETGYYDVAVAASITSASRSLLLRAIHSCTRPLYCDTDSLICSSLDGVEIHDSALGAWKFEGSTDQVYIVGKKIYCAWNAVKNKDGTFKHKIASKGAKLSANVIRRLALGKIPSVQWTSEAPNFSLSKAFGQGKTNFVSRKIRVTH